MSFATPAADLSGQSSCATPTPELPSMIARPDGTIVWANNAWCTLCAFPGPADVMGRDLRCIQGPGTDRAELKRLMDAIKAESPVSATLCNYNRHGRPFRHTVEIVPIADPHGAVTLFRATSRDIAWPGCEANGRQSLVSMSGADDDISGGRRAVDTCRAAFDARDEFDDIDSDATGWSGSVPRALPLKHPSQPSMVVLTRAWSPYAIVWASEGWLQVCGFSAAEIMGRDLGLIQGPGTDCESIRKIMAAARSQTSVDNVALVNYAKNRQPFRHVLSMRPVYENGEHAPPTLFRATSTDVRSLACGGSPGEQQPSGGYLNLGGDENCQPSSSGSLPTPPQDGVAEEDHVTDFWGDDIESLGHAWEDVACGLELLELEQKVAMARERCSAASTAAKKRSRGQQ